MKLVKRISDKPVYFYSFLLSLFLIYSIFHAIPHVQGSIGVGSDYLIIGDRDFYIEGRDHLGYKANFLYPLILKILTNFLNIFNFSNTSKVWNLCLISITSLLSIGSLILIKKSTYNFFGKRASIFSSWLFIFCPYVYFFSLNGGQTMFIIIAISYISFLISESELFDSKVVFISFKKTLSLICLVSIYLSSMRPSMAILVISLNFFLYIDFLIKRKSYNSKDLKFISIVLLLSTTYAFWQMSIAYSYIIHGYNVFLNEPGSFFGYEREVIKEVLSKDITLIRSIKNDLYYLLWKVSDFVSGISDIRNTFTEYNVEKDNFLLFPFFARVAVGLFYIYPFNILWILGTIHFRKRIFHAGLYTLLIPSIISLLPSLVGVARSRYLMMISPILFIIAGAILAIITKDSYIYNVSKNLNMKNLN